MVTEKKTHTYSRAEAIAANVLIDVTAEARRAGLTCPVAVTCGVWRACATRSRAGSPSAGAKLAALLARIRAGVGSGEKDSRTCLGVSVADRRGGHWLLSVTVVGGGDENGAHCLTVMTPDEEDERPRGELGDCAGDARGAISVRLPSRRTRKEPMPNPANVPTPNNPDDDREHLSPPPPPDLIFSYTRAEAIADGVLVDVTEAAKEAGFVIPVAVTAAAWADYVRVPDGVHAQDERGRLWDVLTMLRFAIRRDRTGGPELLFQLHVRNDNAEGEPPLVTLKAVCGPNDDLSPCITVMLPEED